MNQNNKDPLELDHEYDGIKELDHPLPRWWLITFWGGIVFAVIYYIYYSVMQLGSLQQEYEKELVAHRTIREKYMEKLSVFNNDKFMSYVKSEDMISVGKEIYNANCLSCHAKDGAGDIGPNLTDKFWMFAEGTPETVYPFIISGNPTGGMPSWGDKLEENDIYAILSYVMSLQGKTHAKAKEEQGDEYPLWKSE
jgi:cytochrome c oxidase cbb3-type subunit 3